MHTTIGTDISLFRPKYGKPTVYPVIIPGIPCLKSQCYNCGTRVKQNYCDQRHVVRFNTVSVYRTEANQSRVIGTRAY